jgi:hypothetical protein
LKDKEAWSLGTRRLELAELDQALTKYGKTGLRSSTGISLMHLPLFVKSSSHTGRLKTTHWSEVFLIYFVFFVKVRIFCMLTGLLAWLHDAMWSVETWLHDAMWSGEIRTIASDSPDTFFYLYSVSS